jgi:hypothetical protein
MGNTRKQRQRIKQLEANAAALASQRPKSIHRDIFVVDIETVKPTTIKEATAPGVPVDQEDFQRRLQNQRNHHEQKLDDITRAAHARLLRCQDQATQLFEQQRRDANRDWLALSAQHKKAKAHGKFLGIVLTGYVAVDLASLLYKHFA